MITLVPANAIHAPSIIATMRQHDKFEFDIAGGDPIEAILETLRKSAAAWSALVDQEVACMWGVKEESVITGAHLWLITTPLIEKHKHRFLVESQKVVRSCLISYKFLYGYVDAHYERSINWMKWLGFEIVSEADIGKMKLLRFEKRAE